MSRLNASINEQIRVLESLLSARNATELALRVDDNAAVIECMIGNLKAKRLDPSRSRPTLYGTSVEED